MGENSCQPTLPWTDPLFFIEKTTYRFDGKGYLPPGRDQLYLLPISGGTPRQLTTGNFPNSGPLSFGGEGRSLYFSSLRREDYSLLPRGSDLFKVNTDSGKVSQVTGLDATLALPELDFGVPLPALRKRAVLLIT